MQNRTITKKHQSIIVYVITALMLSLSFIYFFVSLQDYKQILLVNLVAIWMLKVKHDNKIPYTISVIGSAALILFYALTRTINIPSIGLQTDIGMIDMTAKIIQGGIVSISMFLICMIDD